MISAEMSKEFGNTYWCRYVLNVLFPLAGRP